MKLIQFQCDTCGTRGDDARKFVGLHHNGDKIELRSPHSVERHICKACANALRDAMKAGPVE